MPRSDSPSKPEQFERLTLLRSIEIGPATDRDPRTWTIGGRPLTPKEVEIAQSITPEEFEEASALAQDSHHARSDMAQAVHQALLEVLRPYGYDDVSQLEAVERAPTDVQMQVLRIIYRTEGPSEAEQMWRTLEARGLARRLVDKMKPDDVVPEIVRASEAAVRMGDLTREEVDKLVAEARADSEVARKILVEAVTEGVIAGVPISDSFHRAMRTKND